MIPSSLHHQTTMQQQQQQQQNRSCINVDSRQMRIFDEKLGFDCLGRGRTDCNNSLLSHVSDGNGEGDHTGDVECYYENDYDGKAEDNHYSRSWKTQQPATRAVLRLQKRRLGQRRGRNNNNNNKRSKSPLFDIHHHGTKTTCHDLEGLVSKTRQLVVDDNVRGCFSRCEISTSVSSIPRKNRSESFETDVTQTTGGSTATATTVTDCFLSPEEGTTKATTSSSTNDSIVRQFRESMSLSSVECDFESTMTNSQTTHDFPIIEWDDDDDDDDDDSTITMNLLSTRIPSSTSSSSHHDSTRFSIFSPSTHKSPSTTLTSLEMTNNSYRSHHSPSTNTSYSGGRRLLRSKSIGEGLVLLLGWSA